MFNKEVLLSTEVFSTYFDLGQLPELLIMKNSITYIAIGCARHSQWNDIDDQQFPIFIKNFKKYDDTLRVNLILIDPSIDDDEHMTKNKFIEMVGYHTDINHDVSLCYRNVIDCKNNIHIYYFNKYVSYIPELMDYINQESIDITNILQSLNKKCVCDEGVLIVHDFSGMDIYVLDKYFSEYTECHSDRILYNITNGVSGNSCYVDLNDPINYVVFEQNNDTIMIDNISKMNIKFINFILNDHTSKKYDDIKIRKLRNRKIDIFNFFMMYFHNLRRIVIWKKFIAECKSTDICKRVIRINELKLLDHLHNTHLFDAYMEDDLNYLETNMKQLFENKKRDVEILYETSIDIDYNEPNTWLSEIDFKVTRYLQQ